MTLVITNRFIRTWSATHITVCITGTILLFSFCWTFEIVKTPSITSHFTDIIFKVVKLKDPQTVDQLTINLSTSWTSFGIDNTGVVLDGLLILCQNNLYDQEILHKLPRIPKMCHCHRDFRPNFLSFWFIYWQNFALCNHSKIRMLHVAWTIPNYEQFLHCQSSTGLYDDLIHNLCHKTAYARNIIVQWKIISTWSSKSY